MTESIKNYLKIGIVHFMAYPECMKGEGPIEETAKKILSDDYFDAIEITWIKDEGIRKKIKSMIETSGVSVGYGAQPRLLTTGYNLNSLDEGNRRAAIDTIKEAIDEAYEFKAEGLGFLSGKYAEDKKGEAYKMLASSVGELLEYAKNKGDMPLLLEIFDYDIDKKSLIGPTSLAKKFAEDITQKYDNFGLMVDLSHIPMQHETLEEAILPLKQYVRHVHMGNTVIKSPDFLGYGDNHPRFGFPNGENAVGELTEFLRILMQIGFVSKAKRPIVSFEVKPIGDEDPDLVIANAKRTLNLAWARV